MVFFLLRGSRAALLSSPLPPSSIILKTTASFASRTVSVATTTAAAATFNKRQQPPPPTCIRSCSSSNSALFRSFSSSAALSSAAAASTTATASLFKKIGFIGLGKMGRAVIAPLIGAANEEDPTSSSSGTSTRFSIYDANRTQVEATVDELLSSTNNHSKSTNIEICNTVSEVIQDADLIVCCVKPQNLDQHFWKEFNQGQGAEGTLPAPIVLSIMAGVPMQTFTDNISSTITQKVVRSMPNTPATIGKGITVWTCTSNITTTERQQIDTILQYLGKTMYVDDEKYIDLSTSISGSGPAYVFLMIEALIDAGVAIGFSRVQAELLAKETMLGSSALAVHENTTHPVILRNQVTSPNGTTAAALYELEKNGRFRNAITDAVYAAYQKSLDMAGGKKK